MKRVFKIGLKTLSVGIATGGVIFVGFNYTPFGKYNGALDRTDILRKTNEQKSQNELPKEYFVPPRQEQLNKFKDKEQVFDVLVIGGGATGTGTALDATTRGLNVAMVEKNDFSSGTSSRTTKMAHGGVRYLEKAVKNLDYHELYFVYECLRERKHFFQVAPHLVKELAILTPCYSLWDSLRMFAGLRLYDILSGSSARIGASEWVSANETKRLLPTIKRDGLYGSMKYWDGLFNDSRFNLALALTSAALGATVLNHMQVVSLVKENNKLCGAVVKDKLTNETYTIRAKVIVNASGAFSDEIRKMDNPDTPSIIKSSSGVHIILDPRFTKEGVGSLFPRTKDGRVMFMIPWEGKIIAGTTDTASPVTDTPEVRSQDVDFILEHLQESFDSKITRDDVLSSWAGIRPLVCDPSVKNVAQLSRDHFIDVSASGLVTICGGKWTSFRKMAEDTIDKVVQVGNFKHANPSLTSSTVLIGAESDPNHIDFTPYVSTLGEEVIARLKHYYGDKALEVARIAKENKLSKRLCETLPIIEAEVVYQVDHEYAQKVIDVVTSRTSMMFLDREETLKSIPRVAELMAARLKWSNSRKKQEIQEGIEYLQKCTKV